VVVVKTEFNEEVERELFNPFIRGWELFDELLLILLRLLREFTRLGVEVSIRLWFEPTRLLLLLKKVFILGVDEHRISLFFPSMVLKRKLPLVISLDNFDELFIILLVFCFPKVALSSKLNI